MHEEGLVSFLDGSKEEDWNGFSLTMPLKSALFSPTAKELLEIEIDDAARRIHSINTLVREREKLIASSTDILAFGRLLNSLPGNRVAIIGGGGTARAAFGAISAQLSSCDFLLRSDDRLAALQAIAPDVRVKNVGMDIDIAAYDVVINTSPIGAADHLGSLMTKAPALYFESLYRPSPTATAKIAAERGSLIIDGVDLLVEQALDQIALFSGLHFDYRAMRAELLSVARAALNSTNF